MTMLQPTRITIFHVLWFVIVAVCGALGGSFGAKFLGVAGGIVGGLIGVVIGHVVGSLPVWLSTRLFFRKIRRSSDEELWKIVNLEFWNFSQTLALLQLAGRNQDVRGQLPRIIGMLEADDELTRIYGWDALRLVFDNETKAIGDYNPRDPLDQCRAKVTVLRQKMKDAPTTHTS
jgi:hypothetical protein